jgi:hypothetical protein
MRAYQVVSLLLVSTGLAFVAGMKVGARRGGPTTGGGDDGADCCGPAPSAKVQSGKALTIPPKSGLPCLLVFCSGETGKCGQVEKAVSTVAKQFRGALEVAKLSPDAHVQEAAKWRLRLVPTYLLLDPKGRELERREGALTVGGLVGVLAEAGIKPRRPKGP